MARFVQGECLAPSATPQTIAATSLPMHNPQAQPSFPSIPSIPSIPPHHPPHKRRHPSHVDPEPALQRRFREQHRTVILYTTVFTARCVPFHNHPTLRPFLPPPRDLPPKSRKRRLPLKTALHLGGPSPHLDCANSSIAGHVRGPAPNPSRVSQPCVSHRSKFQALPAGPPRHLHNARLPSSTSTSTLSARGKHKQGPSLTSETTPGEEKVPEFTMTPLRCGVPVR